MDGRAAAARGGGRAQARVRGVVLELDAPAGVHDHPVGACLHEMPQALLAATHLFLREPPFRDVVQRQDDAPGLGAGRGCELHVDHRGRRAAGGTHADLRAPTRPAAQRVVERAERFGAVLRVDCLEELRDVVRLVRAGETRPCPARVHDRPVGIHDEHWVGAMPRDEREQVGLPPQRHLEEPRLEEAAAELDQALGGAQRVQPVGRGRPAVVGLVERDEADVRVHRAGDQQEESVRGVPASVHRLGRNEPRSVRQARAVRHEGDARAGIRERRDLRAPRHPSL